MMTVAEASALLGISSSTIRLYEKQFELRFARGKGGQRLLGDADVENLRIIREFRAKNVPVEEIRRELTPTVHEVEAARPAVEDVIAALVARQDELERVIKAQQAVIQQILGDNQKLLAAQEQVQLLLVAPKEPDPRLDELTEQVRELEESRLQPLADQLAELEAGKFKALAEQLEALSQEVQALPDSPEGGFDELQSRLAEVERELKARPATEEEPLAVAALREQVQSLEAAITAKARGAEADQLKGLQRRLLDLEAAMAARDEALEGARGSDRDEDSLLETLVTAIQQDARRQRPWWKFWG